MAKFTIEIDCDNDAFREVGIVSEIRRLLKATRWMIGQVLYVGMEVTTAPLLDHNGNKVGKWTYDPEVTSGRVDGGTTKKIIPSRPAADMSFMGDMQARPRTNYRGGRSVNLDPADWPPAHATDEREVPPDTPSLDTSFHDHEMDVGDDDEGEAGEVAANMNIDNISSWGDAKKRARDQMHGENSEQILDNVADALWSRVRREMNKKINPGDAK